MRIYPNIEKLFIVISSYMFSCVKLHLDSLSPILTVEGTPLEYNVTLRIHVFLGSKGWLVENFWSSNIVKKLTKDCFFLCQIFTSAIQCV